MSDGPMGMTKGLKYAERKPGELKNYPLNIEIYGESLDREFIEDIKSRGIIVPIVVCRSRKPELDGTIVCGRRRRMAAIMLDMETVPTLEWNCEDTLEFEELLLADNVNNARTPEQKLRMCREFERIETEKAKRRQLTGQKADEESGEAAEIAAKRVGLSRKTAKAGIEVVDAIDKLNADGHEEEAAAISQTLNTKSVSAAARMVHDKVTTPHNGTSYDVAVPASLQGVADSLKTCHKLLSDAGILRKNLEDLCAGPGGEVLSKYLQQMRTALEQISVNIKACRYWAPCPDCRVTDKNPRPRDTCGFCRGLGWITERRGLSTQHEAWLKMNNFVAK